jgi:cyanosortase A-associated protein
VIIEKNREKINLFGAASTSICLIAAVYCLLNPTAGKRRESAFVFPDRVPLKSWQTIYTQPLSPRRTDISHKTDISDETDIPHEEERLNSGKLYSYRQNGTPLEIEMRYLAGTRGDIVTLINKHTNIPKQVVENTDIEKIPEVGYYSFRNRDALSCWNQR